MGSAAGDDWERAAGGGLPCPCGDPQHSFCTASDTGAWCVCVVCLVLIRYEELEELLVALTGVRLCKVGPDALELMLNTPVGVGADGAC